MKGPRNPKRHHPEHSEMKKRSSRKMRRESKRSILLGVEPQKKMAGLQHRYFCCGGHASDWRY